MRSKKSSLAATAADKSAGAVLGIIGAVFKVLLTIFLIFITTGLLFTCVFAFYVKTCLTDDLDVSLSDFNLSLSSTILYEDNEGAWQELVTLSGDENRIWVDYDSIPKEMEEALVAIEDKRFYEHKGVDWYRTVAALANMFFTMKDDFGGSTITQQLIKNLTKKEDITVQRKLLEIFQALEFEKKYTKEEIMEWYLNAVYFGEGCWGVYTASQTYFDKDVSELSLAECASIIAITNNPSKYDPFISTANNKDRQKLVLREMYSQGYIDYDTYIDAVNEELVFVRSENEEYEQQIYSYYVETVIGDVIEDLMSRKGVNSDKARDMLYSGGYLIYSCFDPNIQVSVDAVYQDLSVLPQSYYASDQQLQSAIVIMDPYSGDIVALAGGVGEKSINFGLNRIYSQRPPGS
ncbi:MAG: penicillin-binding protein, partial [Clostridia bacterium]|nr:penicillin-binding protein [Clostridia bacterium]